MAPCSCHTDCVERPLSRALRSFGAYVGAHPWPFLLAPMALTVGLGMGFMMLKSREANDIEGEYTPVGGPAKAERCFIQKYFPTDDARRFSPQRLSTEGSFATFIAVASTSGGSDSVLTKAAFTELLELDSAVRAMAAGEQKQTFEDLCARWNNTCLSPNPLITAVEGDAAAIETLLPSLTFPLYQSHVFLGYFLGDVVLGPGNGTARPVLAARAMRLVYFFQEDGALQREDSKVWIETFLKRIPVVLGTMNLHFTRVTYFSSESRQKEFGKITKKVIPLVSVTYFLTIFFSIVSCARMDCVRTKIWIGIFGVMSAGLSVISSFGLLLFCGMPFVITAANSPFLILGVGVDDMFILVSCWQQTEVKKGVPERMADTYARAAVSVTITTLTDVLAFYIGVESSLVSIQSFCVYTGTAFVFCYIYNLTFLGAVLALNGRREESNKHWLTFKKVMDKPQESKSPMYNRCCIGGAFDESTGTETEHPMYGFFRNHYAPFLMHTRTKLAVVVLYLTYLVSSVYGCSQLKEGINVRNLAVDRSYVVAYYDSEEKYFTEYGPRLMVAVTESIPYWNSSVRADLENCMQLFEKSSYVDKRLSESWLRTYEMVAKGASLNLDDHTSFMTNLKTLFQANPDYEWDVNISATEILASRFFIQTVNVTTAVHEKNLLNEMRELAEDCEVPLIVYHPAFIYFDQFAVIMEYTIQNVLIAAGAMLVISLLLIPNPLCSLWVTFTIASVFVGVTGFMALWNVNLDSISMINLVICIGFSVDFSAHISYAFVSSEKPKVNDKAVDALYRLGFPILQAAVSTIVGILVLPMSSTYIFRTFFKIMFLVIFFGSLHGLVFLPVFLTFFAFCGGVPNKEDQNDSKGIENSPNA
ncbi:patched domain-containing protein 3-like [Zootoca vivipara]|uniref:patched domain-containing protein 3-like n=1 Tax=Zootoca vivipara TaxID=8524 RepID=UPI00293BD58D|nr:patched domain-containing protein 3-like [Zootoca vivipara]